MLSASALALVAAFASTSYAQTPSNFNVSASTNLPFSFQGRSISAGENLQYLVSRDPPTVSLPDSLSADDTYILLLVDPDAPSPLAPSDRAEILHYLQPGVRAVSETNRTLVASVPAVAPYAPPEPPSIEPHRYIFLLYEQDDDNFEVPSAFSGYNDENRTSFDALIFQQDADLGDPVAASYFLTGNNGTSANNGTGSGSGSGQGTGTSGGASPPTASPSPSPIEEGIANRAAVAWSVVGMFGVVLAAFL